MFKIGDFSRLSRVSVKALRYYDEMELLKPAHVDEINGYRYYSADQMPRLNRILALKDLGFTLEQIARLLEEGLPAEQVRGMLRLKQAELQDRVQEEQERLARVETRLEQIEKEGEMPNYEAVIKQVGPQLVASIRDIIPTYSQQGRLWEELCAYLAKHKVKPTGPCLTRYHDGEYRERDVDAEVCEPIESQLRGNDRVKVHELPAETMACVVHHGSYQTLPQAYAFLLPWIEKNNYKITGPEREIYLRGEGRQDDESYVTEIQFPVKKT